MDKLEQITLRLRQQKPRIDDEEAFVNDIMALIDEHLPHTPLWLKVVRTVSSMAATFLIMLYVWQQRDGLTENEVPRLDHVVQNGAVVIPQTSENMDRKAAIDEIAKYWADKEKRQEIRKQSIHHNYARL